MRLVLTEFLSLDGVSQGPGSPDEDTSGGFTAGGWFVPHMDEEFVQQASDWLDQANGLLFGRRTYEAFARDWPAMPADDLFAARMNGLPKYVASGTLTDGNWAPTTLLGPDAAALVTELKQQPGRELQIHGSAQLAQSLFAAGLIDEIRLVIAPVVVGSGRRLFVDGGAPAGLRLVSSRVTTGGLTIQTLEYLGAPEYGTYDPASTRA
jgi:dihydrofolate reductase